MPKALHVWSTVDVHINVYHVPRNPYAADVCVKLGTPYMVILDVAIVRMPDASMNTLMMYIHIYIHVM